MGGGNLAAPIRAGLESLAPLMAQQARPRFLGPPDQPWQPIPKAFGADGGPNIAWPQRLPLPPTPVGYESYPSALGGQAFENVLKNAPPLKAPYAPRGPGVGLVDWFNQPHGMGQFAQFLGQRLGALPASPWTFPPPPAPPASAGGNTPSSGLPATVPPGSTPGPNGTFTGPDGKIYGADGSVIFDPTGGPAGGGGN